MFVIIAENVRVQNVPTVTGLPEGIYLEYFGKTKLDSRWFIIIRPEENWEYTDFVVLMNDGKSCGNFKPVKVLHVERFRDGGTTNIRTEAGEFHFPTPFSPEEAATLDGKPLDLYGRHA